MATALTLYNSTVIYTCSVTTAVNASYPTSYSFQPYSDLVVVNSAGIVHNDSADLAKLIGGYWSPSGMYQTFPSGTYTIIAG